MEHAKIFVNIDRITAKSRRKSHDIKQSLTKVLGEWHHWSCKQCGR